MNNPKITISIDLTKIDKAKIREVNGAKYAEFDIVPLKEERPKTKGKGGERIESGNRALIETHFVCQASKKLDDGTYEKTPIIGNGAVWREKGASVESAPIEVDISDSIPF